MLFSLCDVPPGGHRISPVDYHHSVIKEMRTLLDAISLTDRWICIVSSWSRHQSNSSKVSWAHWIAGSGSWVLCSGGLRGVRYLSSPVVAGKLVMATKLDLTFRSEANNWANGVTIRSSPCLKLISFQLKIVTLFSLILIKKKSPKFAPWPNSHFFDHWPNLPLTSGIFKSIVQNP